ncbi:hypothetical protein [Haliangium sp. UPWRP_2]|uniref:hypothetical protein n=1 Tax=Haliangium sp. UPWRP_2 TaxID=1931276 RepID=UPI000B547D70|nr:hypothetical protein [Haliangium sp. UPWRP_2]PSM32193.1 hypothetical protein BVG81_001400 [Haliangium sp. UPWRP_2]HNN90774.1 hypothetical protein [Pseudomonadota bacterium]
MHLNTAYQSTTLRGAEQALQAILSEQGAQRQAQPDWFKVGISFAPVYRVFGLGYEHAKQGRDYFTQERQVGKQNRSYRRYGFTRLFILYSSDRADCVRQVERELISLGRRLTHPGGCANQAPGGEGPLSGQGPWFVYLATK